MASETISLRRASTANPSQSDSIALDETEFDIVATYNRFLEDPDTPMPIAAVLALSELVNYSGASTTAELLEKLKNGAAILKKRTPNPISLTAGCDIFLKFVSTSRQSSNFDEDKQALVREAKQYAASVNENRGRIARLAVGFIPNDAIILVHSYSRVVLRALLYAHKTQRISVFVTEAKPRGTGVKAYEILRDAGVPCSVILDTAVGYVIDKIDLVLVGSEAVVESGGLINAVGSRQIAMIAKLANKPFYALAESYKFLRHFPLSQTDLPTPRAGILNMLGHTPILSDQPALPTKKHFNSDAPLQSHTQSTQPTPEYVSATRPSSIISPSTSRLDRLVLSMSDELLALNPEVDYTPPGLISSVISDAGILTPSAVSQFLVNMWNDEL